ncbi:uncharacterized protein [Primulina huaijiensis]|uniref:uncharacterized protein n=1 Tax=Primulina huaijiensis TaxID=1492673 RepID=UPI003CC7335D
MAIEVFSDTPNLVISPRISFSHDLSPNNVVPIEQYLRSNNSSIDFDFCVFKESFGQDPSSADELFSDGKILPIQIKKPQPPPPPPAKTAAVPPPPPPAGKHTITPYFETRKPISESDEKHSSKSLFWGLKRSTSLNGGGGNGRGLCPLTLLSRSNSTGSNANVKRSSNTKQSLVRSSSCSQQKPPLRKSNHSSHCYGVKIHPVLNVPPANLFGLGSIFNYSGTNKSKKK